MENRINMNKGKTEVKSKETITVFTETPPKIEKTEEGYKYIFTNITNISKESKIDFKIEGGIN